MASTRPTVTPGHRHRRAALQPADVLELRREIRYDSLVQREFAVRDLRDEEQDCGEAEQHEQAGANLDGTCGRMVDLGLKHESRCQHVIEHQREHRGRDDGARRGETDALGRRRGIDSPRSTAIRLQATPNTHP